MVLSQTPKMLLELVLFEGAAVAWGVWQFWQVRPGRDKSANPTKSDLSKSDPPRPDRADPPDPSAAG